MSILQDPLGIHGRVLGWREQRTTVLASNIANADSPHYKARDLDFRLLLDDTQQGGLHVSHSKHLVSGSAAESSALKYRIPASLSLDGNTVEANTENSLFAENSMRYQTTMMFLNSRIKGVMKALKGE